MSKHSKADQLRNLWHICRKIPGGSWWFSKIIKHTIPYSGSIDARVRELSAGRSKIQLADKRKVRNHLNSIHAIALLNLGELCSGLALNMGLANNIRGIVTEIRIQYHKKARGLLTAECHLEIPEIPEPMDYWVESIIRDIENDVVASIQVCWRLSPKQEQ